HLFQQSLATVQHVVANSQDARDTLVREHGVSPEKIAVIYNGLIFAPEAAANGAAPRDAVRALYGAGSSTPVLLCVAMFRPEKNQRELIEIVSGLPSSPAWQLLLAGDGAARTECE